MPLQDNEGGAGSAVPAVTSTQLRGASPGPSSAMADPPALGFKRLTTGNWVEQDPVMKYFAGISAITGQIKHTSGNDWAGYFLGIRLGDGVPLDIQALFEVARGVCLYGSFFYPLYHLGEEQIFRVADAAVGAKCKQMGGPDHRTSFAGRLDWLKRRGVLSEQDRRWWEAITQLRNIGSHPEFQSLHPPGSVLRTFQNVAREISALFETTPVPDAP
jgi:hypothetical protein